MTDFLHELTQCEARLAELETEVLNAAFSPSVDENGAPITWQERAEAAESRIAVLTALRDNQEFVLDYIERVYPEALAEAEHALAERKD